MFKKGLKSKITSLFWDFNKFLIFPINLTRHPLFWHSGEPKPKQSQGKRQRGCPVSVAVVIDMYELG